MAFGIEAIAELDDPVGSIIGEWKRPNGLNIQRVRVPLGVIGIIYSPDQTSQQMPVLYA